MLKRILVTGSIVILMLLSSCRKQAGRTEAPAASLAGPQDPNLRVNAAGYHGRHFTGPVYIPRSSPLEDGTTAYSVTYRKGVAVVSKEDAMRHLVNIGEDDSYVFDSSSAGIARLKPGSVLLIAGLALCTVIDVQKISDGYLLKAAPARITDAIKDGRLEGKYRIDFGRMQALGVAEFDVDFSGYNYHVRFTPRADRIEVLATIKYGGRRGMLAYEGTGYLGNFVSTIKMRIKNGILSNLDFNNSGLNGEVELKWYALANGAMKSGTVAEITSWPAELAKNARLAGAAYHLPILLGAMPFDLKISLGFSFIPSFSSQNSVIEGGKLVQYNGSGGFVLFQGETLPSGTLNVQASAMETDNRVLSAGPVGFSAAAEAPRLELALGWPPATAPVAGYLNFVTSYGIVTNGVSNPKPCQTNIMAFSANAGAAYTEPNTFANWGSAAGASSSVSLWSKTLKAAGATGLMCPG